MAEDALKIYWDHFFKAETGTYEKSTWLDLFLAEFLVRLKDGAQPKELINFCPVSGVVTLVGCELLCGIHRVTSSVGAHAAPVPADDVTTAAAEPKGEESRPASLFSKSYSQSSSEMLRKYLLGGVAWRCLALLKALGVEGLSCCRQLSSVLIWVFGELSGARAAPRPPAPRPPAPRPPRPPMHQLFSDRIWSKQKPTSPGRKMSTVSDKDITGRSRRVSQSREDGKSKRKSVKQAESSESGESADDLQALNRSLAVKLSSPDHFQYFTSPLRSAQDCAEPYEFLSHKKTKPKADDYMTDKHKEVINSEISTFEFTLMITDLLQELCKAESSLSGSEGSQISMQCINFSLKNLCSLQFGSLPTCSEQDPHELSHIKVALTELLMVALDKVLVRPDLCAKLINNGTLPMLLRILEDVICKSSAKYHKKAEENPKEDLSWWESDDMLKYVFGIAYSVTAFFHCLLMQCRTVDNLREFTEQFKLYGECLKGGLLKECVEFMLRIPGVDVEVAVILAKKLLEAVGRLISGMKRVRSEVLHSAACPRSRHKGCRARLAAGLHHHHDLLGDAGAALPLSSSCCVSVLYGTLASLLPDEEVAAQPPLRHKILRVMLTCGVCCCFCPGLLMENIVRLMLTHGTCATKCLQVLEHTVYGELGASILIPKVTDQLPCSVCEPSKDMKSPKKNCLHPVNPVERKSIWSFLIHYNSLLQLDNQTNVLHATVSHLLRVTPKCRLEMKYELLFSVIYPTFIVAKHRYIIRMEESAYFLTVSCLNIFSSLLNTVSFADQFIQKGGLSYVLELVSLPEFSKQCCSILEIAIVVEIFKLINENSDSTYCRDIGSLASVQMLFKSLSEMNDRCFKIFRLKLPEEKYEELRDVTVEEEKLSFEPVERRISQVQSRKLSMPRATRSSFASSENVVEETVADHVEGLASALAFWRCCAALCLCSPPFRAHAARRRALLDSFALLRLLLHALRRAAAPERRLLVALAEALLTVHFAVADVTSERSKEASCAVLRGALGCAGAGGGGGGGGGGGEGAGDGAGDGAGLRALCEALVRVATAEPSAAHAMPPPPPHAKVPPLLCQSDSSAEGSSSEDSIAGPYASEHSEPYVRADEGYEADVEINKFDLLTANKARKAAESPTSSVAGAGEGEGEGDGEGAGRRRAGGGRLAHPELCLIVLDILTDLIHRLVSEPAAADTRATGAALARACCGRLAAALAGARAPPPPLLRRLLAPRTAALLASTDPHLAELQRSVLELIHVVASQSITAEELALLLRLLTRRAALPALLPALLRLARAAVPAPRVVLAFPAERLPEPAWQRQAEGPAEQPAALHAQAEAAARALAAAHRAAGLSSCWARHAARCGAAGAGWAPWLQGFALAAWLRRQPPAEGAGEPREESRQSGGAAPLHVVSVGHDSLMLEMWLHTDTGAFTFRLSRPETSCYKVLSETRVDAALPPAQWCCLALNVKEVVHKRKIHIQVTLYIDGCECETVSLPLQGILVRKVTPTHLLLGHAAGGAGGYQLGAASVYRAPALGARAALHVAAHAPRAPPHQPCQVNNEIPNYARLLTPNVLDSNIDWDQVYDMSSAAQRELNENLLLSFSADAPDIVNLYHQTTSLPTVFSARSPGPRAGAGAGAGAEAGAAEPLACVWEARAPAHAHRGLAPALAALGGPPVLLYLFARVVEMEASAELQATALAAALRACGADDELRSALLGPAGLALLPPVLAAPRCRLSHHMLQVILAEACTAPVLAAGAGGLLVGGADAAVREPALLALLAQVSRHLDTDEELEWEVESAGGVRTAARGSLWALTLSCLQALVEPAPGRRWRAFNQQQLLRHDFLRLLLAACKERQLHTAAGPGGGCAGATLARVVRGLLGEPPAACHLAALAALLLLLHQASDTFVTHSRANFYFLAPGAAAGELRAPRPRRAADKLAKGLLNVHIQRGRKHNVSSTSENSDIAIETSDAVDSAGSGEEEQEKVEPQKDEQQKEWSQKKEQQKEWPQKEEQEQKEEPQKEGPRGEEVHQELGKEVRQELGEEDPLAEYIVVDVDDVENTTVEMYSSGIYQEERVRAGAGPGWTACEGLLLLLRDAILLLSEHDLQQAMLGAIQPETLVVLANHRDAGVRAAVLRVVAALQRRAVPELAPARASQRHLYRHFANQIALYPGSWELAAACAALVTKCDVPLEDQLEDDIWVDVSTDMLHCSAPLLATLPTCLHEPPLAHNVSLLVRRIVDKAPLKMVSEICVVEVVVRCVCELGARGQFDGRALLLGDMDHILAGIADKALHSHHHMQIISDMHHLLTYVELSAESEGAARAARGAQAALFVAQLTQLEAACCSRQRSAGYFTTVLSSAVSLASEGVSQTEMEARHLTTVTQAVSFLQSRSPALPVHEVELFDRLLTTLIAAVSEGAGARRQWWSGAGDAGWLRALRELLWWAAAPAAGVRALQPRLLRALHAAPHAAALLAPPPPCRKLAVYLLLMLRHVHALAEGGSPPVELCITDWARGWALALQDGLAERLGAPAAEAAALLRADEERWARAADATRLRAAIAKVVFSRETLAARVTESAMAATRLAVDLQNSERKAFMEHLRRAHSAAAAAARRWQRLVDHLTHEQALFYEPESYPVSWELDDVEAPGRIRVRLRRAHLAIDPRFLQPRHRYKPELAAAAAASAAALRGVAGAGGLRGGLVARLQLHETVAHMARVTLVAVALELPGELLLTDRCIHFVPDSFGMEGAANSEALSWALEDVRHVAARRWCLQERAAELFLASGRAHLLAFAGQPERAAFLQAAARHLPARLEPETLSEAMSQWRNGTITNWEYLMKLNGLAGRTYNDLMQYPVLPFVIADYSSRILDLNDPASFRDLSKPMAIQNKNREQHYINTYNDLKAARREGCGALAAREPHHYASLYSNPGCVLHYLVRLPPFTQLLLHYQDNNFDMPDRTFHSLATTWRLITNDSPTDVKELVPELFYLPELFHNDEGLNLGIRQCGAAVDDVELPPWAADARLFTLIHRQALEAPLVTERLPLWIDLVFGYKQTGAAAVEAVNVFPHCTYYGFDPARLEDEVDRTAAAAMVRTYGQAPRQLLRAPHPHRAPDLAPAAAQAAPGVWAGVAGARWGGYCGAPGTGGVRVALRRALGGGAARLAALPARALAAAAAPRAAALFAAHPLHGEPASAAAGAEAPLALLTWGHADGVVRLKRRRDAPLEPALRVPPLDRITAVATSCSSPSCPIVLGLRSGRVLALRARRDFPALHARPVALLAHRAAVSAAHACAPAGLLATASVDGLIVLWDLDKLTYIRTLPNRDKLPVTHVTISETLCDVASVHDVTAPAGGAASGVPADVPDGVTDGAALAPGDDHSYEKDAENYKSLIRVHTVNARFVGSVKVAERVSSVCYSNAPEGVSVNAVAAGLRSGGVRLYSAWDLRPLLAIPAALAAPLVSLTYSSNSEVLFGCYADGTVVAWYSGPTRPAVSVVPAHALF